MYHFIYVFLTFICFRNVLYTQKRDIKQIHSEMDTQKATLEVITITSGKMPCEPSCLDPLAHRVPEMNPCCPIAVVTHCCRTGTVQRIDHNLVIIPQVWNIGGVPVFKYYEQCCYKHFYICRLVSTYTEFFWGGRCLGV